jgi:hypothetical protein
MRPWALITRCQGDVGLLTLQAKQGIAHLSGIARTAGKPRHLPIGSYTPRRDPPHDFIEALVEAHRDPSLNSVDNGIG